MAEPEVKDPGGHLKDIADPALRSAVARIRGAKGNAAKAAQSAASPGADTGSGSGSTKPGEERDRDLARREMRRLVRSGTAKDADKVAAARILAGLDEVKTEAKAPTIEALEDLSAEELEALVLAHL